MRETIDTMPLWDAFRQTELCPFCFLENHLQNLYLDMYLGDSVMEPDVRIQTNRNFFCREHTKLLYEQKVSKLGLALMTHTHLLEVQQQMLAQMDAIEKTIGDSAPVLKRIGAAKDINAQLAQAEKTVEQREHDCVICSRMDTHMKRYYETARHMWTHDSSFRQLFDECKGFCLPHWSAQLADAQGVLLAGTERDFILKLDEIEKRSLAKMASDLEWFTKKFDYRNTAAPWGDSKDALPRALNLLKGYMVSSDG